MAEGPRGASHGQGCGTWTPHGKWARTCKALSLTESGEDVPRVLLGPPQRFTASAADFLSGPPTGTASLAPGERGHRRRRRFQDRQQPNAVRPSAIEIGPGRCGGHRDHRRQLGIRMEGLPEDKDSCRNDPTGGDVAGVVKSRCPLGFLTPKPPTGTPEVIAGTSSERRRRPAFANVKSPD